MGFKALQSAAATLDGIEVAHMIRKGQLGLNGLSASRQFAKLAA
jgi:putative transposase